MGKLLHPLNSTILKNIRQDQGWFEIKINSNQYFYKKKSFLHIVFGNFICGDEKELLDEFSEIKSQLGFCIFVFNPYTLEEVEFRKFLNINKVLNYKETFINELKNEEEMRKKLAKNYKNEINKCAKLTQVISDNKLLDDFYSLYSSEMLKEGGALYPKSYVQDLIEQKNVEFLSLVKDDIYLGSVIYAYNNDISYYFLGAYTKNQLPGVAKYLLFNVMLKSYEKGCKLFDFGGVSLADKKLSNLFTFKKRFGGEHKVVGRSYLYTPNILIMILLRIIQKVLKF